MFINTYIERFKFLILSIVLLISAVLVEINFNEQRFNAVDVSKFREVLLQKEARAQIVLRELTQSCSGQNVFSEVYNYNKRNRTMFDRRGMEFMVYDHNKLLFWSSSEFYVPSSFDSLAFQEHVIFIDHAWFYIEKAKVADIDILVLVLLKNEYPYQNKFLVNDFHDDFNVPSNVRIASNPSPGYFDVRDARGDFILGLSNEPTNKITGYGSSIALVLYFASNLMFLFFFYHFMKKFRKRWISDLYNLGFIIVYVIARIIMVKLKIPSSFAHSTLFDPQFYAFSERFPSLGDLLLDAIFLWHLVYQLQRRIKEGILFGYSRRVGNVLVYVFPFIICSFGFFVDLVIKSLVVDSNITVEAHKVLDINSLSVFAYLVMAIMIFAFVLLANGFIYSLSRKYDFRTGLLIFLPGFVLSILFLLKENPFFVLRITALLLVFFLLLFMVNYRYKSYLSFSIKVLIIFISSVFITLSVDYYLYAKKNEIKKIYAFNLANEHDILTEQLLTEAEKRMQEDTILANMALDPLGREDAINNYLQNKFLSGFLSKYRIETTVCGNTSRFSPENRLDNCDLYFEKYLFSRGQKISNSTYHYVQNIDGSISYIDSLHFTGENGKVKLFVELKSRLTNEELGYPELLLNKERQPRNVYKEFSYARYNNGNLINEHGDFHYCLETNLANQLSTEYATTNFGGYDHLLFKVDDQVLYVISNPRTTLIEILISISYVFLFFFMILMVLEFVLAVMNEKMNFRLNFKGKIQASFIGVLVLSFLLIGISIILLNVNQFRVSQYEQVNEKLQSIIAELEQSSVINDHQDPENIAQLTSKLLKLSNIYFTDINLFDLDGILLTSSRMEIYDWGLVSPRMNIEAFSSLLVDKQSRFEHIERIGSLRYLSAYAVVKNKHNKPLAYLNVPYFTKQSAITQRVSSLVVAFINIYVLLIVIATLFGVFISNKVTKPLLILKEKIREMKLGNKNEKIVWESNDEIGGLINDYNRMVNELESSAQKLAASERDLAWREMAKQIAHEIKNPLTPMKLNIQLLNRAWDTNDEHFHDRLKRVSQTLVEQIDVLATTASEFSNFAHSPEIHNEDINISSIINQCLHLFSHYQGIEFSYINNLATSTTIVGDKEKINRIIINILKNAVQSIPAGTLGRVVITSWEEQCWLCISVSDNGTGIQDDIKQKLFEPYFTTKTSGSGLGLAICKTLVTGMRGEIHFESTHGLGTTFTVKFTKE